MRHSLRFAVMICVSSLSLHSVHTEEPKDAIKAKAEATSSEFFPKDSLDDDCVRWYTEHLVAMKERPLNDQGNEKQLAANVESYRFLWLRTFDHPIAVRLEKSNDHFRLLFKELSGKGGYKPGELVLDKSRDLTDDEAAEAMRKIDASEFWKMSTREQPSIDAGDGQRASVGISDGAQWILEGVRGGKYHVVDRQSPSEDHYPKIGAYRDICLYLLKLSGIELKTEKVY